MSSSLALSALLARMSQQELFTVARLRRVNNPALITDPLGLALEFLKPDSIARAISHLDAQTLDALAHSTVAATPTKTVETLQERALLGWDERIRSVVPLAESSLAAQNALATAAPRLNAPTETTANSPRDPQQATTTGWYGQAVLAVRVSSALMHQLRSEPAKMNRKGVVAVTATRALAEQLRSDPALVSALLSAIQWANLAAPIPETDRPFAPTRLSITTAADRWLELTYPERWAALVTGLHAATPDEVVCTLTAHPNDYTTATTTGLTAQYPLLPPQSLEHASRLSVTAEALGATTHGWCTPAFTALFNHETLTGQHRALNDFPPAAPGVYLQPDLTLVAPGPLTPHTEYPLFDLTEVDQLGAAAVLRITQGSLERALKRGYTTESIRAFFSEVSLTGIPQPLDFMLTDLERERPTLTHRVSAAHLWADRHLATQHATPQPAPSPVTPHTNTDADHTAALHALAERVHAAAHRTPDTGDLSRIIELAIRDRNTVQVTAVAGSEQRTFTLLPLAVTAGRLRATDQIAGVERTLPLTAITAVIPA